MMLDDEDTFIVGAAFGAVITVAIVMLAWAITGGFPAVATTDNCPVEYKAK